MPPYGAKDGPPALSAAFTGAFQRLASPFATGDADAPGRLRASYRDWLPELGLFLLAAASFMAIRGISLTHDVVWQFWIARRCSAARCSIATSGSSIHRSGSGLWFWSAVPVPVRRGEALAHDRATARAAHHRRRRGIGAARRQAGRLRLARPAFRHHGAGLLGLGADALFDFGQREQIALICSLPYAMLAMRRARAPADVDGHGRCWSGSWPAYGFAMKH